MTFRERLRREARRLLSGFSDHARAWGAEWVPDALYSAKRAALGAAMRRPSGALRRRHAAALDALRSRVAGSRGLVVYLPTIDWGYLQQRPHQILRELGARGYVCVFCTSSARADEVDGFREVERNVLLCSDTRLVTDFEGAVVWLNWTVNEAFLGRFRAPRVVYEFIDELEVFGMYCARMRADHERLVRSADVVVASAGRLHDRLLPLRPDAVLAPNAVHPRDFADRGSRVPDDLASVIAQGRPIVGYYGAVARWMDFELLNWITAAAGELSFVIIGPDHDGSAGRIARRSNVHVLGERPYRELPAYSQRFDVAIIPFLVNEVTRSTSPVKLFEYMAAGAPVVTTDMDECRKHRLVSIAATPTDFLACVRSALGRRADPAYQAAVAEEVVRNTWAERVDRVLARLEARGSCAGCAEGAAQPERR